MALKILMEFNLSLMTNCEKLKNDLTAKIAFNSDQEYFYSQPEKTKYALKKN